MKKYYFLIVLAVILGLVLTGCSLLSNVGQVPTTDQSGITYLTKNGPLPNLVGLWHLDGNALDSSLYDNDGMLNNFEPPYCWVPGMFGQALSFDGVDDYVEVSNSASIEFEGKSNITMEAWVYPKSYHGTDRGIVLEHIGQYYLTIDKNGKLAVYFYGVSPAGYYISTSQVTLDTWTHIAATYNGSSVQLYINGNPSGTTSASGTIKYALGWSDQPLRMGYERPGLTRYFHGLIDEVRIWDIALTYFQLEPVAVAMDIKPGSCPNPLNVKNQGVLPVAILGTPDFDVSEVDLDTVKLEGKTPLRWAFEDVATPLETLIEDVDPCFNCTEEGPDGFLDLTLKFDTQEILSQLSISSDALVDVVPEDFALVDGECKVLTLTGYLYDGTPIRGEDRVLIIKKGKW